VSIFAYTPVHVRALGGLLIAAVSVALAGLVLAQGSAARPPRVPGVCPPFFLRDEAGRIINPITGENAEAPYSPKQTCGACHDYDTITEGFHFQQGKGEQPTPEEQERYRWVSSPGDYGGPWCSPAPLYRQLAAKHNTNARLIDMTSFEFVTQCGVCHPGGGPLELDCEGHPYDRYMTQHGLKPGADNGLDGDYYQARWSETGVVEADCLLCHLPEYDYAERTRQLEALNFKWAATAGSGLARVTGSVQSGEPVRVAYDAAKFGEDGTVAPHIVPEPRNETCLHCHGKPAWKKRGASFSPRTDVHIRAGLRCTDCHPAAGNAVDDRVRGPEVHQVGKGDDPGGHVRDDLDNTCRDCADCHTTGYLGAPTAKHTALPASHLDTIACQTCHIPFRYVTAAQVQVSDVFNAMPFITPPGKRVWTFYDALMRYWNHYGELHTITRDDQPTDPFRPVLARYKGKIWPVNRVHSAWPGLREAGQPGLNQPFMKDVFMMWQTHNQDPAKYPDLSNIRDDNGDGIPEVNRPEEIDALISSVRAYLTDTGFDLTGRQVVWVYNDRVYESGSRWEMLPKHDYEASPYASVHKYSHDVAPARAALGVNGCGDCHAADAPPLFAQVLRYPFGAEGKPVTEPQYRLLGFDADTVRTLNAAAQGAQEEGTLP